MYMYWLHLAQTKFLLWPLPFDNTSTTCSMIRNKRYYRNDGMCQRHCAPSLHSRSFFRLGCTTLIAK